IADGSTDNPLSFQAASNGSVDVVSLPPSGKSAALNAGGSRARHDILVFADARQIFARDALRALVAPFADPEIGGVSGELVLDCEDQVVGSRASVVSSQESGVGNRESGVGSTVGAGIGAYWRFEKWLRRKETEVGST